MSTITTIQATDLITNSRTVINTNFSNLNTDKIETSVISTDNTFASASDAKIPSQLATKTYITTILDTPKPPTVQVFTSTGTWTKPTGCAAVIVEVVGGGGGGGGSSASNGVQGWPGNGGGYSRKRILASALSAAETVTIGAGGTAGGATTDNAGTGGTTSFGSYVQATGGAGGKIGGSTYPTNTTGVGSLGDININGSMAMMFTQASNNQGVSGASHLSGTQWGAAEGSEQAGTTGLNYGGGATGGNREVTTSQAGGVGGPGVCIVTEFY